MEKRGLILAVVLILGLAMFASSMNIKEDITGKYSRGATSTEDEDKKPKNCRVAIYCSEYFEAESSLHPPTTAGFKAAVKEAEANCEEAKKNGEGLEDAKQRCQEDLNEDIARCKKDDLCVVNDYNPPELSIDSKCKTRKCNQYYNAEGGSWETILIRGEPWGTPSWVNGNPNGLEGYVCEAKDGTVTGSGKCEPKH